MDTEMMKPNIRFISAGAGSGKTYRLSEALEQLLSSKEASPSGVIATTFTRLAASELRERVRQRLLEKGHIEQAAHIGQALIGTVNGVCGELLHRFAFEAGLSPDLKVLEAEQAHELFSEALESATNEDKFSISAINELAHRLQHVEEGEPTWRGAVLEIVNAARANDMRVEQLRPWAKTSAESLLAFFDPPLENAKQLERELDGAISNALSIIGSDSDSTKKTADYRHTIAAFQAALRQGRVRWSEWVKLSKASPAKKSQEVAKSVAIIASDYAAHPRLHADIRSYCSRVFDLAARSMESYQKLKASRGLLDFTDQEQRLYHLLDEPRVRETLADEIEVLLVDEFQDTSPIQLALFMKLASLANQTIWVGDVKQAIYGFRGSDPSLMDAVIERVTADGRKAEVLSFSWRARPSLVKYTNEVFSDAFLTSLPTERVNLKAKREELSENAAVAAWHLGGRNKSQTAAALAGGICTLVESGYEIVDKKTGELRNVMYGDIAVLCKTNARLQEVASQCALHQIPVAYKRAGLLATPEAALAMACLRRLADPYDTLATAEIRTLTLCESPEAWLGDRLAFLEGDHPQHLWGEISENPLPVLTRITAARDTLSIASPLEALELALDAGEVRKTAVSWGPTSEDARQRLRNIDLLIETAARYEEICNTRSVAATVAGLILWLGELADREEDWQAESAEGQALSLLTHHRAKGLEWPVVIAMDLESDLKMRLWDLTVLPRESGFNIDAPLADRSLRYWPWPFGRQRSGIRVQEKVQASAVGAEARFAAEEEARRLLYVSLTRARDLVVIALPQKKPGGELLETLRADWMLPHDSTLELPSGALIPSESREIEPLENPPVDIDPQVSARWIASERLPKNLVSRDIIPSRQPALVEAVTGACVELGEQIKLDRISDMSALGGAVHTILAVEIRERGPGNVERVERVLHDWGLTGNVDPGQIVASTTQFIEWATSRYSPTDWLVEHPVTHVLDNGQVAEGAIDLLLRTDHGWVLVDHKSSPRPRDEWAEVAYGYSGQMQCYKSAIEAVYGLPVIATWIHFAVGGALIPLEGLG